MPPKSQQPDPSSRRQQPARASKPLHGNYAESTGSSSTDLTKFQQPSNTQATGKELAAKNFPHPTIDVINEKAIKFQGEVLTKNVIRNRLQNNDPDEKWNAENVGIWFTQLCNSIQDGADNISIFAYMIEEVTKTPEFTLEKVSGLKDIVASGLSTIKRAAAQGRTARDRKKGPEDKLRIFFGDEWYDEYFDQWMTVSMAEEFAKYLLAAFDDPDCTPLSLTGWIHSAWARRLQLATSGQLGPGRNPGPELQRADITAGCHAIAKINDQCSHLRLHESALPTPRLISDYNTFLRSSKRFSTSVQLQLDNYGLIHLTKPTRRGLYTHALESFQAIPKEAAKDRTSFMNQFQLKKHKEDQAKAAALQQAAQELADAQKARAQPSSPSSASSSSLSSAHPSHHESRSNSPVGGRTQTPPPPASSPLKPGHGRSSSLPAGSSLQIDTKNQGIDLKDVPFTPHTKSAHNSFDNLKIGTNQKRTASGLSNISGTRHEPTNVQPNTGTKFNPIKVESYQSVGYQPITYNTLIKTPPPDEHQRMIKNFQQAKPWESSSPSSSVSSTSRPAKFSDKRFAKFLSPPEATKLELLICNFLSRLAARKDFVPDFDLLRDKSKFQGYTATEIQSAMTRVGQYTYQRNIQDDGSQWPTEYYNTFINVQSIFVGMDLINTWSRPTWQVYVLELCADVHAPALRTNNLNTSIRVASDWLGPITMRAHQMARDELIYNEGQTGEKGWLSNDNLFTAVRLEILLARSHLLTDWPQVAIWGETIMNWHMDETLRKRGKLPLYPQLAKDGTALPMERQVYTVIPEIPDGCKEVFIPVHVTNNHWVLYVVDFISNKVWFLDSLGASPMNYTMIADWLEAVAKPPRKWNKTVFSPLPRQQNGADCGFWVIRHVRQWVTTGRPQTTSVRTEDLRVGAAKTLAQAFQAGWDANPPAPRQAEAAVHYSSIPQAIRTPDGKTPTRQRAVSVGDRMTQLKGSSSFKFQPRRRRLDEIEKGDLSRFGSHLPATSLIEDVSEISDISSTVSQMSIDKFSPDLGLDTVMNDSDDPFTTNPNPPFRPHSLGADTSKNLPRQRAKAPPPLEQHPSQSPTPKPAPARTATPPPRTKSATPPAQSRTATPPRSATPPPPQLTEEQKAQKLWAERKQPIYIDAEYYIYVASRNKPDQYQLQKVDRRYVDRFRKEHPEWPVQ